jgi:hypothetical protein
VDSLLAERRRREMNTDGGYWILSTDPRAADEARSGTVHVQPGTEILLMTDGFSRLVDTFAQPPDWLALLDPIAAGRPLMDEVSRLRRIEQSDPTGTRWPRLSVSDDASALFARVVAETDSEVHNVS